MLLEARALPEILDLANERNAQAATLLEDDLRATSSHPRETSQLLVSATIEVARRELTKGSRLPRLRSALYELIA